MIFITSVIDAKENQEVAVANLPGAFLHAENDQDVIMFMRGRLAELMTRIAPQTCNKCLTIAKVQNVLCKRFKKLCMEC